MRKRSDQDEIKWLRKQNRILKRQNGQLKKDLKVDVKKLQADCFKEGYETGRDNVLGYIERMGI